MADARKSVFFKHLTRPYISLLSLTGRNKSPKNQLVLVPQSRKIFRS